ncbi:LA2681 family HEPN domain-containing protein [Bacillus cereus]|uniref:LA2681 family HEPN domain-containing protein n=1 Tax=Bacillus cereus TaxID=1396 RepID=UPI000BFA0554|nr:LA2681 family HEPN domain-containing protein [Bacillus cereus]PFR51030.1 hypothetical protein COK35_07620 [Bacillus cereus]
MDVQAFMEQADARIGRAYETEIKEFLIELDRLLDTYKDDSYRLCNLYYAKANHLSVLQEAKFNKGNQVLIEIGALEELHEQSIYCRRKALALSENLEKIEPKFKVMMLTNLANEINHVGRFVEALEIWDSTEKILGRPYPMAIGNMGLGITTYSKYHYNPDDKHFLDREAFYRLQYAIEHKAYLQNQFAYTIFKEYRDYIQEHYSEEFLNKKEPYPMHEYDEEEKEYREWCLENKLFLNPFNDVSKSGIAVQDVLGLPNMIVVRDKHLVFHSYFNQLKQEFVSARWFLYDSLNCDEHFSDSEVKMYDTMDNQMYGLTVQKLKIAFRSTYSIFDKIAYFLNEYYEMGIPKRQVNFKSIWYENLRDKKWKIREKIKFQKNGALKGLYWLSKDLFYRGDIDYRNVIEPDAQKLDEIRNYLEHKFFTIHFPFHTNLQGQNLLTECINEDELHVRTLKLLKLARAALIYLSFSIHIEEQNRKER